MRAADLERDDTGWQVPAGTQGERGMTGGGDDDKPFREDRPLLERSVRDGFGRQGSVDLVGEHGGRELLRVPRAQLDRHVGVAALVFGERPGQAHRGRALHGAKAQHAARPGILHRLPRLLREVEQPVGIAEQHLACGREVQPLALPDEEGHAELLLELADASRDVGLDAVEAFRRAGDAALAGEGAEDPQGRKIHGASWMRRHGWPPH